MCIVLTLRTNKHRRKSTELFPYLKKRHNCLQGWDTGWKASQCQTAHAVLNNTCQSYQRVTLCIAFNKHSPPRTLSDVNSSAERDFENQAVVIAKLKAGKVVAPKDLVMPSRGPFIQGRRRPAGHGAQRRGRFPTETSHLPQRESPEVKTDPPLPDRG